MPDFAGGESQDHDFTKEEADALWKAGVWDQVKGLGKQALDLFKDKSGSYDLKKLLAMGAGLVAANKPNNAAPTGYQGKIPKLTATSNMLTAPPVGRRPGSGGINYGGGTTYRNEKGEVVSSNEKTLAELRAAAESNPFNRPSTYENPNYGRPPVNPPPSGGGAPGPTPGGGGLPDIVRPPTPGGSGGGGSGGSPAPGSSTAPVPGQYGAVARPGYQQTPYTGAREGTTLPDGRILTAQGIYNPKNGVVITPDGYRVSGGGGVISSNKDTVSAEDAELMKGLTFSMAPNKEGTPEEVKNFIKWQMSQANPFGQGTMADVFAKQGITDPYSNPIVQQQAQEQLKGQDRRDAMYAAAQMGLDPSLEYSPQGYGQWEDPNWQAKQTANAAATAQRNQQQAAAAPNVTVGGGIADLFSSSTAPTPSAPADPGEPAVRPPDVNDWAKTQEGQAAGGINSVYGSINQFLAGNPSQEALQTAMQNFGVSDATLAAAKSYAATPTASAPPEPAPPEIYFDPTAGGGGSAKGGLLRDGFVVPADVVSHFGNGSSEAGLKLLASKVGATAIKGDGDGMSDSIKTKIDGVQEARVANDEAYISPEMVKKLGNGSPEKGAKKLYAMMDKIRQARTGTTEQGKEINPNKFMPGGSVQKYQTGGATTRTVPAGATGSESSLSNWAGDYVTNMLGQGAAQANKPYEAYTGPLTAGASGLQQQAFGMASNLQTPGSIGQAAGTAGGIANLAANMQYTPQTTNFLGQPNVSGLGMSPSYGMNQQAPNAQQQPFGLNMTQYGPPRGDFGPDARQQQNDLASTGEYTGGFDEPVRKPKGDMFQTRPMREYGGSVYNPATGATSRDMVPLLGSDPRSRTPAQFLNPESQEPFAIDGEMTGGVMRPPKPDYSTMTAPQGGLMARGAQQGGDIAQQYMNPYLESALRPQMAEMQRVADIARVQDAGRLTQAGAYGGSRQAIMESEGRRNLLGKQSEALGQGYATAYDKAMAQFNADQNRRSQEAQFGASFGLQGLQTGLQAAQAQGSLGTQQNASDISNLNAMLTAGTTERGIESEGIAADKAQFEEARLNPYKMVQFQQSLLSGMPLSAQSYSMPGTSNLQQFSEGASTIDRLLKILSGQQQATTK
jgi:hypothetical protein